jgi:predicted nucleic acid-binding protein
VIRDGLVETGPLIALVDHRDRYHAWVRSRFAEILPPLQTCEAVLTEACFLAGRLPGGSPAVLELFERGVCALMFDLAGHFNQVSALVEKYGDVPMSLADACLVRMSEVVPNCVVLTLDRDFRIYRRHKR